MKCDPESLPELLRQSLASGGSGRGLSFWSEASKCGKLALLKEESRGRWKDDPASAPAPDLTKATAFAVGGIYHKLHELWDEGSIDAYCLNKAPLSEDVSVNQGIHLFRGWLAHWDRGTTRCWGRTVASELTLPSTEYAKRELASRFGEVINAKPDRVVYMDQATVERVAERLGHVLSPGYYMVDFKTAGSDYDPVYYREGNQSYWYPYVWNLDFPETPVKGFIYDIIVKPNPRAKDQTISLENFPTPVYIPLHPEGDVVHVVNGLFKQGRENIHRAHEEGLGNRSECIKIQFGKVEPCPFFQKACSGF